MTQQSQIVGHMASPRGAYPHYRRAGDFIFVSGTSSRRPDNSIDGADVDGTNAAQFDIRMQTRAVLDNIGAILVAAGASLADIVEISTFLVDMTDFAGYNEVYGQFFTAATGPARTTVAVRELPHPHLRIEIKAVAWCPVKGVV